MDGISLPTDIHSTPGPAWNTPPSGPTPPPTVVKAVYQGVPSCTLALLRTARHGGACGYRDVGRQVGEHLCSNVPFNVDSPNAWIDLLDHEVVGAIQALPATDLWMSLEHLAPLLTWLKVHFPAITSLVPARHHATFTRGFVEGVAGSGDWIL